MAIIRHIECSLCVFTLALELQEAGGFDSGSAQRIATNACSQICTGQASFTWRDVLNYFGGKLPMATCASYHSSKVQGAGLCCNAVSTGLLTPPAVGTILPVYTPGSLATIPAGRIAQVTDAGGHCASCIIVGSTSKKHPGKPVLKFVRGNPACPTAGTGCCAMAA